MAPVSSACAVFSQWSRRSRGAFRVDQDVGDVLHIAHLVSALAHLEQRIEAGRQRVGRIEQQAVRELGAPAGGQLPVLALDVVDDGGAGPGQQGGQDQADALAGPGRCHRQHMLGTVVAQIAAAVEAEHDALLGQQTGLADIGSVRPAGRAVGGVLGSCGRPAGRLPRWRRGRWRDPRTRQRRRRAQTRRVPARRTPATRRTASRARRA